MIFNILYESCPKIRDINFLGLELSPYPYLFSRYFRILYRTRQKLTGLELKTCRRIYIYILVWCPSSILIYIFSCTRDRQNVFEGRLGEIRGGNFEPKGCLFYESWCLVLLRGNSSNRKGCMQTTWQLCAKRKISHSIFHIKQQF